MAGLTPGMAKNFKAEAAVTRRRFVKFGAADTAVVQAAASADSIFGVSSEIDAAIGEPCDVFLSGLPEIEYGGNVTRGDLLTADAQGRAVVAAPAAGVNARTGGVAMVSGVVGDIGLICLSPGRVQG